MPFSGPRLYAIAGRSGRTELATVHIYDPKTEKWLIGKPLEERRASPCAVGVLGRLYVLGGIKGIAPVSTVESMDPRSSVDPQWRSEMPMPFPRRCFAACELAGGVYVLGGAGRLAWGDRRRSDSSYTSVQRYDPGAKAWSNVTDLPGEVRHHAAASLGGRIYCVGGWRGNVGWDETGSTIGEVYSWAPGEEEWRKEQPLQTPRYQANAHPSRLRLPASRSVASAQRPNMHSSPHTSFITGQHPGKCGALRAHPVTLKTPRTSPRQEGS